jgi:hypothetical protein
MADDETIRFRVDKDLGEAFRRAADRSPDPEADLSKILRQFCRWYAGLPDAKLPERPAAPSNTRAYMDELIAEQDAERGR